MENTLKDEKVFNDNELEDIMTEIESLEKEFVGSDEAIPEENNPENIKEVTEVKKDDHKETIDNAVHEAFQTNGGNNNTTPVEEPSVNHSNGKQCDLNFNIGGAQNIDLSFNLSGKLVKIKLLNSDEFCIELENGARFTLPLK